MFPSYLNHFGATLNHHFKQSLFTLIILIGFLPICVFYGTLLYFDMIFPVCVFSGILLNKFHIKIQLDT